MHPRRKIRDFVGDALNANQRIAPRVGVGRVIPVGVTKLPSIEVYTGRERVEDVVGEGPRIEKRIVDLRVEIQAYSEEASAAQDLLDDLAEQVTFSVLEDETQGDVAWFTEYRETLVGVSAEGDRPIVSLIVGFDVTYEFEYGDRTLPDAKGIDADIDIESETAGQIEERVIVTLRRLVRLKRGS